MRQAFTSFSAAGRETTAARRRKGAMGRSQSRVTLARLRMMAVLFLFGLGCAPQTDLFGQAAAGPGDANGGGPAGALVDPRAGAVDAPTNLAAIVVRLPGPIVVAAGVLRLHPTGPDGADVALGTPEAASCTGNGACYRVPLGGLLEPSRSYVVELTAGTAAPDGSVAPSGVIGAFDTAAGADQTAPSVVDFAVAPSGPCVAVRFTADEPVDAQVVLRSDASETRTTAGRGTSMFDLAVSLGGLTPGGKATIVLLLTDRGGNVTEAGAGEIDVPPATPSLAITEVLANAAGTEPTQEFVELRNVGDGPVATEGLRIEDAKGADVLPAATLEPGAYALVVPLGFDPQSARDTSPAAGTVLIRVDTRIGSDGLTNGGEVVRLRMPGTGTEPIVSSYGGWVDVSASSAAGKSAHRLIDTACDHPTAWTSPPRPATPGWGTPP
jgi:hypothetical protein